MHAFRLPLYATCSLLLVSPRTHSHTYHQVASALGGAFISVSVAHGMGSTFADLSPDNMIASLYWFRSAEFGSFACLFFLRASVCAFILRILEGSKSWRHYLLYGATALNAVVFIVTVILTALECLPTAPGETPTKCFPDSKILTVVRVYGGESCKHVLKTENIDMKQVSES